MCVTWPLRTIPAGYILFCNLLQNTVSRNNRSISFIPCVKNRMKTVIVRTVPLLLFFVFLRACSNFRISATYKAPSLLGFH